MKSVIREILAYLMWMVSKIYPYSLSEKLRGCRDILYTMWVRNFIGHIGKHTLISYPCELQDGSKKIVIGEDTIIYSNCIIECWERYRDASEYDIDIPPAVRKLKSKGNIVIGNNVWLGDKVSVLSGVNIGDNVIVGANSVVTKNVPSNCVVAGIPAKIIKKLDS